MSTGILAAGGLAHSPSHLAGHIGQHQARGRALVSAAAAGRPLDLAAKRADAAYREIQVAALNTFLRGEGSAFKSAIEQAARRDSSFRADAVAGGINGGLFMARQLEAIAERVLDQPLPALNALNLFPVNTEAAPGALTYTVRRVFQRGEATIHRGGGARIPQTTLTQREEQVPIRHLVSGFEWTIMEQQSADFANFSLIQKGMAAERRAILELHNDLLWRGSNVDGIWGVFNYPWLDKVIVSTTFSASADKEAMVAEIMDLISYPSDNSLGTFDPTDVVFSHRLYNFLAKTMLSPANGSNISLLKFIAENNTAGIKIERFHKAQELAESGPSGEDGVFVYRKDEDAIRAIVSQPIAPLPLQQVGFSNYQYMYSSVGGLVMPNVGNNVLGWITLDI